MKKLLLASAIALFSLNAIAAPLKQYQPGFRLIDGSQLNNMVNIVNGLTGQGGVVSTGYFSANTTGATGPTPLTGTVVQAVGANATVARIELDAYGAVPIFSSLRRNGTKASPTVVVSGNQIGSFNFHGASSTTANYGPAGRYTAYATETWSGTAGGTKLVLSVTPNTTQTITDAVTVDQDSSVIITSASANALAVGRVGSTNPVLKVNANTTTVATGIAITGAAAAGGVAVAAISSGTDENLTINAKGAGTVTINGTATGNIVMGAAVTGVSSSVTGALTARSGTATPAAASAVAALSFGSAGLGIYWGTGTPSISAVKGSIYIQTDGSSSSTRLFINNGTTTWIAITTAS